MTNMTTEQPVINPPEISDLIEQGFTDTQILQLRSLRSAYPFVEYVDSRRQWGRLQFLKWRVEQGDLQRAEEEAEAVSARAARTASAASHDVDTTQDAAAQGATMSTAS